MAGKRNIALTVLLAAAFLLRLGVALFGILSEEGAGARFARPDTSGYLAPARALAVDGAYLDGPGGNPDVIRAPGFPVFLAVFLKLWHARGLAAASIALISLSVFGSWLVYRIGREWFGAKIGVLAAAFHAFLPTVIANAPMLLSDTLFAFFATLQLWSFLRFFRTARMGYFFLCTEFAAMGALIRPINIAWIFPAIFLVLIFPGLGWKRKLAAICGGVAIFYAILFPWLYRNSRLGAGYCIDVNTGAMYYQNGAMLMAAVTGEDYETLKQRMRMDLFAEFADTARFPDEASKVDYQLKKFKDLILAHPGIWIRQHFRPHILLPDVPTFLEILGVTQSDRGTMNVLQKKGLWAAINHYFDGRLYLPLFLLPLLAVAFAVYVGAAGMAGYWLWHWRTGFFAFCLFLAFAEYYFFLPGPITAPRYQLPALPILCVMAGAFFRMCYGHWKISFWKSANLPCGQNGKPTA